MHQRKRNSTAFRPCAGELFLEDRLVLSGGAAGSLTAAPGQVGAAGSGLSGGLTATGTSIGSTGTDVLSIGTTTITGVTSQVSPTIAFSSFQDVSDLASDPQFALRIPGLTPVNLPTGPLPGILGTPENVIGYWGYNDDFANGYYQYVSSIVASTPYFRNPAEGFHLLSETPPSLSPAPTPSAFASAASLNPDTLIVGTGSALPRAASVLTATHGNVGNRALAKKVSGRTGLQTLSPRYGGAGTVDLVKGPTPTSPNAKAGPATGPTQNKAKPRPQTSGGTKPAPPVEKNTQPLPETKKPAGPAPRVQDSSTRTSPATQDDSGAGPLHSNDKVERGAAGQGASYPENRGETDAAVSRGAQTTRHSEAPAGPAPDLP